MVRRCITGMLSCLNYIKIFLFSWGGNINNNMAIDTSVILAEYKEFVTKNENISYSVSKMKIEPIAAEHKWVGAQYYKDKVYAIPNDAEGMLVLDRKNDSIQIKKCTTNELFKWTGGVIFDGKLYGYPRRAARCFCYDLELDIRVDTNDDCFGEHHYGGVCTDDGVIFQPPRNSNYINVINIGNNQNTRIKLSSDFLQIKYRYCGSVIHPNGYIYMLPEKHEKVIKLNPRNNEWKFIGGFISAMVFDAKIAVDGNIYGYSAYGNGILKIDVYSDECSVLYDNVYFGAYGSKLGIDGAIYSVPGDGRGIWKYQPTKDELKLVFDVEDDNFAKYAGGVTTPDGEMIYVPATSNQMIILKPSVYNLIDEQLYKSFFVDSY